MNKIKSRNLYERGLQCINKGEWEKAEHLFITLMESGFDDDDILFQLALTYQEQQKYKDAIKLYNYILNNNPNSLGILNNLGLIYRELDNYEQAIQYFNQYIQNDPTNAYIWFNLGMIYKHLEMNDKAIEVFIQGLKFAPQDNEAWYHLGEVYQENEDYENALNALNKAVKLNPKDFIIWDLLGDIYFEIKEYQNAIQCYEKAALLNQENKEVWNHLGRSYHNTNNLEKAIKAYKKALQIDQEFTYARFNLSLIYSELDEYDMAIEELRKVLKIDSSDDDVWYQLGANYFNKKDYNLAIEYLNQALKRNSEDLMTLDLLSEVYHLQENYESEIDCLKQILQTDPLNDSARETLEQVKEMREFNINNKTQIQVLRGGDWRVEGNQSIFNYKVKIQNISQFVITDIQIILTSIPEGLRAISDRRKITSLKPNSFISPSFRLITMDSCVGDSIEGIVTFIDNRGKTHTTTIRPFEIKYVCNLLTPKEINPEEFNTKLGLMKKRDIVIESDINFSVLIPEIKRIVQECNFSLLQQLQTSQNRTNKKIIGVAQGLYDKQDVALSIAVKKMDQGSKLIVEALSEKDEKLTDLLKDVSIRLDDVKCDTELIKEYSSQIEIILEKTEYVEQYLRKHLGSEWQKIKNVWEDYKKGKIGKKELLKEGLKIIGKKFIKYLLKVVPL